MRETVDKPRALELLRARGIAKAVVSFSGGNDEGGADGTTFYDASGAEITPPKVDHAYRKESFQNGRWLQEGWVVYERTDNGQGERPATPEEIAAAELNQLLEAPIYAEFGNFAGEFSVYGTVTWDVEAGTCLMAKEIQSGYDHEESYY